MNVLALMLMLTATVCWASAQVIGKLALRKMDVSVFNAVRTSIVVPFAILFVIFTGDLMVPDLELIFLGVVTGVIGRFIAIQIFFYSVKKDLAHRIISIGNSYPLWSVILAILFLGEEANLAVFMAAILIVAGGYLLTSKKGKLINEGLLRILPAFLAATMWGLVVILNKYCLGGMTISTLLIIVTVTMAISCNVTMIATHIKSRIKFDKGCVRLSILSAILGLFIGDILSYFALSIEKASVLAPIFGAVIPFGFVFSVIFLKERPSKKVFWGMLLIFVSVLLVTL